MSVARLAAEAMAGLVFLLVVIAVALFASAGTVRYPRGWAYLAVFGASCTLITIALLRRDRALLQRRLDAGPIGERDPRQRWLSGIAGVCFLALFALCGIDARRGWSDVPAWVSVLADGLVAVGFAIVHATFRANSYTSATVYVATEQRVADDGPYAVVRHPMYAGAVLLLAATPVALGAWAGLAALPPLVAAIVARLLAEERTLRAELRGYAAYERRVTWRLVPHVW